MEEAQAGQPGPSFQRLRTELAVYTEQPTGVGLDVPHWLRRLELEVQRVRTERTAIADLVDRHFHVPKTHLTLADVQRQLADWDQPLSG
jgi:hypothetical protein